MKDYPESRITLLSHRHHDHHHNHDPHHHHHHHHHHQQQHYHRHYRHYRHSYYYWLAFAEGGPSLKMNAKVFSFLGGRYGDWLYLFTWPFRDIARMSYERACRMREIMANFSGAVLFEMILTPMHILRPSILYTLYRGSTVISKMNLSRNHNICIGFLLPGFGAGVGMGGVWGGGGDRGSAVAWGAVTAEEAITGKVQRHIRCPLWGDPTPWTKDVFDVTSTGQRSSPRTCNSVQVEIKFHLECKLYFIVHNLYFDKCI